MMVNDAVTVRDLQPVNLDEAINLLKMYGNYMYQEMSLTAGKTNFYDELDGSVLLKRYQPPVGTFILAYYHEKAVGCVGLKKWDEKVCEMKRMFVLPEYRGQGIGKLLSESIFHKARTLGYTEMLLDTNKEMAAAIGLYKSIGFKETAAYCYNENRNVVYMKKSLKSTEPLINLK